MYRCEPVLSSVFDRAQHIGVSNSTLYIYMYTYMSVYIYIYMNTLYKLNVPFRACSSRRARREGFTLYVYIDIYIQI